MQVLHCNTRHKRGKKEKKKKTTVGQGGRKEKEPKINPCDELETGKEGNLLLRQKEKS